MAALDWIVLAGYLVVITAIGLIAGARVRDTGNYFLGHRKFGPWLMIGQSFGVGTHAEMPVSLAGAVYRLGASGIWFQWKNLFATPFFWIMAPIFRRVRRTTIAEMTEDRYGWWMGALYIIFAMIFFIMNVASMLKGAGKVISQATGGYVAVNEIVIGMTVIFIVYSFIGGLVAAAWTDLFQGLLIIVLSFLLVPFGWGLVGGLEGMRQSLPASHMSLATDVGINLWTIAMLTVNGLVGIMAQPHMLATVGTGKDERTCRIGFLYGNYVKRVCTVGWAFVGLIVAAIVAQGHFGGAQLADPEDAFGFACRHLLFPGAIGLLIAAILAANMSTCSAFMVDSGALFTQGLYRRRLAPGKPDRHYLWVGRVSGLIVTLLGVVYALLLVQSVLYTFLLTETMATYMGISLLGGIIWRRANRWGAVASLLTALVVNFVTYWVRGERPDHWDPNVFLVSLLSGIVALVVVSLLTPAEPEEAMASFFGRLDTPHETSEEDGSTGIPPTLRPTIDVTRSGRQLLLVHLLNPWRPIAGVSFFRAYREDLVGFATGWALVVGLVLLTWIFFNSNV
jgi:Na+/proline symporter